MSELDGFVNYIYDYSVTDKELEFAEMVASAAATYKALMLRKKIERIRKEYGDT